MNKRYFLKGILSALGIAVTRKATAITENVKDSFDKAMVNPQVAAPNATVTPTPSVSVTPSRTTSPSVSLSVSPSRTPSQTRSVSISVSPSATNSVSSTVTPTATPTRSPSTSTSPSTTPALSSSPSITPSITSTNTPSISTSPSSSLIPSTTPSVSITPSITPSASSVLPVELLYFELINSIKGGILVNFATISETNNSGYELLKSTNFSSFNAIASIKGKINSYQLETYSYEDKNVNNGDFVTYQLKQNDTNGFSKIIATESIQVLNSDMVLSEIFPNPTFRNAYVKINTSKPIALELQIKNTLGFTIGNYHYKFNSGNHQLELPIESIARGLYILNFKMNEKTIVRKLVLN